MRYLLLALALVACGKPAAPKKYGSFVGPGFVHSDRDTLATLGNSATTGEVVQKQSNGTWGAVGSSRLSLGLGAAAGAPTVTPTLATSGAGVLTGVYQYAYTEADGYGETTLSPAASITGSSNSIQVTIGLPRRGMSSRRLYRTKAGGSTFYLVHDFGGGSGWAQTIWVDNTADVSLVTQAPSTDTTQVYALDLLADVKTIRTPPSQVGAADLTVLTSDPSVGGDYAEDVYGPIFDRTHDGDGFASQKTGTNGSHFAAYWRSDTDSGQADTTVFQVKAQGYTSLTPTTLPDSTDRALSIGATLPSSTTASRDGVNFDITSAGSSAHEQRALSVSLEAGYTGASNTEGAIFLNATATTGDSFGSYCEASGAATSNVGVEGRGQGGTNNVGVFGGLSTDYPGGFSGAVVGDSGGTASDIYLGLNSGSLKFEVQGNGDIVGNSIRVGQSSGPLWSSGAGAPTGACTNGSLYSNTAGTTGSTLYTCVATAWVDVK